MSAIDSILALDPATRTGWAFIDVDGSICSGAEDFGEIESHGARVRAFGDWVVSTLDELQPAVVAYEVPAVGLSNRVSGNVSRLLLGAFYGQITAALHMRDTAGYPLAPADVKKHVTGFGSAAKSLVAKRIRDGGFDPATHDEADALAVLLLACERLKVSTTRP